MYPKYVLALICIVPITFEAENYDDEEYGPSKRYDGYSVLSIIPDSKEKLKFVRNLENDEDLDAWQESSMINKSVDIMVPPQRFQEIIGKLYENQLNYSILIQDVQKLIDKESQSLKNDKYHPRHKRSLTSFFENYRKYYEIYEYLDLLKDYYSPLIEVEDVGITYHNKTLKLVKIATKSNSKKPIIWIDAGIHAREWITPATAIYFIYKLLTEYDENDQTVKHILKNYDWYFMPLVNPDGYEYTFGPDRMWRKNLSKSRVHQHGVDLNRNFPFEWNNYLTSPKSRKPKTESYMGPSPLSEKETQTIARILNNIKGRLKMYVTLHSYEQLIVFPWGSKKENIKEYNLLKNIGTRAAESIKTYAGTEYKSDSIIKVLYPSPGCSIDWAYGELGIKYSFGFELRDRGEQGFKLSNDQIVPVGEETWLGIKSMVSNIQAANVL